MARKEFDADRFAKKAPSRKDRQEWAEKASLSLRDHGDEARAIREANAAVASGSRKGKK